MSKLNKRRGKKKRKRLLVDISFLEIQNGTGTKARHLRRVRVNGRMLMNTMGEGTKHACFGSHWHSPSFLPSRSNHGIHSLAGQRDRGRRVPVVGRPRYQSFLIFSSVRVFFSGNHLLIGRDLIFFLIQNLHLHLLVLSSIPFPLLSPFISLREDHPQRPFPLYLHHSNTIIINIS